MNSSEPRLPQIDPVTFAALNTIDTFLARAPLTRAEHAEANKSIQHVVQALESQQAAVRQMNGNGNPGEAAHGAGAQPALRGFGSDGKPGPVRNGPEEHGAGESAGAGAGNGGGRVVAEIAEEIFRKAKA